MSEEYGVKVEEIFDTMEERFRPEGAEGVDASFGYDISGKGKWKLTVKDGKMSLAKTDDLGDCVCTTITDPDTFVGVNIGKVDGTSAFTSGKFKVDGDLGMLGKTAKMFRKFTTAPKEMSVRDYLVDMFATVEERFKPEAAVDMDVVICIDIQDDDGGAWSVIIKDQTCKVVDGKEGEPTVTLEINKSSDWVDLTLGKTDAQTLMAAGAGSVVGDLPTAMKWGELFEKYVDPMGGKEAEQELVVLKKTISVDQRFATGPVMGKFFNQLKKKKIIGNKCPSCGRIQLPPREICAECRVDVDDNFVEVGPKGELRLMETVYYSSPDPLTGEARETPYGAINVLLDGCQGNETMWHFLRQDQLDKVTMGRGTSKGTRLRPVWKDKRQGDVFDILYFEIDE